MGYVITAMISGILCFIFGSAFSQGKTIDLQEQNIILEEENERLWDKLSSK